MTSLRTIVAACSSCGAVDATPVARATDFEFESTTDEFDFVRCDACGLVYLRNRPDVSELPRIYPPRYFQYDAVLGGTMQRIRQVAQRGKLSPLRAWCPPGAFIVDVGCGNGALLHAMKTLGDPAWRLMGVDFSEDACAQVQRFGIETRCGRFETMTWDAPAPTAIVMNQVIEHLDDPVRSVGKAFEILAPGGVLIVETPSTEAWDARLFRRRHWGGWHCPRHWQVYDPRTLGAVFTRAGFEVVATQFLLSPYNWLHSLQNWCRDRGPRVVAPLWSERVLPSVALVCLVDVAQRAFTGRTSNQRMVGRKPGHHEPRGPATGHDTSA